MDFVLHVRKAARRTRSIPIKLKRHTKAFASYASEDRNQVIARVQGMQKAAPSLDVFLDVVKLRSGQDWEKEISKEILANDIFYLFWSQSAMSSPWVDKEWRCAYREKGLDFIDPVPLESPEKAPPPTELAAKHFYDPLLAYIQGKP